MSSISIPSGGYYQLSGQSSDLSSGTSGNTATNPTQALIDALDSVSNGNASSSSNSDSYLLDLSPAAQQLINGGSTSTPSTTSSSSFTLTTAQQNTINSILEKYKSAPQDQATFDEIQNDLAAAGLSPEQLAAEDQATSFNPTGILVGDLSGNITDPGSQNITQSTSEQSKISQYMQNIISLWEKGGSSTSTSSQTSS